MFGPDEERFYGSIEKLLEYCDRIAIYMHRFGGKDAFLTDMAYQDACVMVLGQIGETCKTIEPQLRTRSDYDWSTVIRFRDFIYHNYSSTRYDIVWGIMVNDIPAVQKILMKIMAGYEQDQKTEDPEH